VQLSKKYCSWFYFVDHICCFIVCLIAVLLFAYFTVSLNFESSLPRVGCIWARPYLLQASVTQGIQTCLDCVYFFCL